MKQIYSLVIILFLSLESYSSEVGLEDISLKVSTTGNSMFVNCAVRAVFQGAHTGYRVFSIIYSEIEENVTSEEGMYASIRTLGQNIATGEYERIAITLKTLDEEEKWFLVESGPLIFPYTHRLDSQATTAVEGQAPKSIDLSSCS